MNSNTLDPVIIVIVYSVVFFLDLFMDVLLGGINIRFTRKQAGKIPSFMEGRISGDVYERSIEYTIERGRFGIVSGIISSIIVYVLLVFGVLGTIDRLFSGLPIEPYTRGILYLLAIAFIFQIIGMPFSLYSQFRIEERFGFNKMTVRLYWIDKAKGLLISLLVSVPLLYGLFFLMDTLGGIWWLVAFGLFIGFELLMTIVYPVLIAPLFNKFTPLEDGSLKDRINALAERLSFRTSGIFVMDGSKRSGHSNAYFTGIGKSKRIVLFDTLVKSMSEDEIVAVLGHEIGHEKKRHVLRSFALSLVTSLAGFWILSLLLDFGPLFAAFGFAGPGYAAALVLLAFCSGPFTFFLAPIFSALSRRHEYEADRFAVDACSTAEWLSGALVKLSRENLSNLTPHPLYSFFYYSHPTLADRLRTMDEYARKKGYGG